MANVLYTKEKTIGADVNSVAVTPYVKEYTEERKKALVSLLRDHEGEDVKLLRFTQSLCPGCVDEEKWESIKIDSLVYVKSNKVWQIKQCTEHGITKEIYWEDYGMYKKAESFQDPGIEILNPHIDKTKFDISCPDDCGLCAEHESHTGLGNIVLTNRCDLTCWYCFFYAKEGESIYEPTREQIRFMLKRMRNIKPTGANAVQLTGGEPTLRDDIVEIVKDAHDIGYEHIQLNTNGITLSQNPQLCKDIFKAGSHILYMSFDGVTPQTNPKNYWEVPQALENCRQGNLGVVLVPTVIGGVNDHELGDIIRFGFGNIDVIRSVNFQPVSLVGRMPEQLRKKQRITIPGAIKRVEAQTEGQIGKEAWFPVPCAKQVTDFMEAIKDEPKYRLSIHFACGMATYVFNDGNKMVPITNFFDVEGFFEYLNRVTKEIHNSKVKSITKATSIARVAYNIRKFVDKERQPKDLRFVKMLTDAVTGTNYDGLKEFHKSSLFIGMMHFQDPFNWDLDRIHKCDIHYAVPDGRVIPFCTFNVIPAMYRDAIQTKFSIPQEEWEKQTGKLLKNDRYHRNFSPEEMKKIQETYDVYRKPIDKASIEPDWGWDEVKKSSSDDSVKFGASMCESGKV